MKQAGHTVLVTGGATGIGLALARKFHEHGNRVILVGRTQASLEEAAASLPGSAFVVADVSQAGERAMLVERFPEVTILINNAGVRVDKPFEHVSEGELESELTINFTAPILLARAFLPLLKKCREAAVINVSSGVALWPREAAAMYCASKAALHSFTKSMRWQLEASTVKVFEVLPPMVETPMTRGRGAGKISAEALADEFWRDFQTNRYEMRIGKVKVLGLLRRLSPSFTDKKMRAPG